MESLHGEMDHADDDDVVDVDDVDVDNGDNATHDAVQSYTKHC